jgi:phosphoribosylaminoimidazole (AIR) synthetase
MRATFNLGIGLIAIVDKSVVNKVLETAEKLGEPGYEIGRVKKNQ